jgi:hypothetical protein
VEAEIKHLKESSNSLQKTAIDRLKWRASRKQQQTDLSGEPPENSNRQT